MRPLLVRLPNWIGDVVMALPALERLHAHGREPILIGKGWAASLLAGHPWAVHRLPSGLRERVQLLRALTPARQGGPRPTIDCLLFPNSFSSALEARFAGLRAIGYANEARSLLLTRALRAPASTVHEIDRFDALARIACSTDGPGGTGVPHGTAIVGKTEATSPAPGNPPPHLFVAADARRQAQLLLDGAGIGARFACIVPFATGTLNGVSKDWPGFAELCARLAAKMPVLVLPGPGEEDSARQHFAQATVLAGVGLDIYAAILERASVVIANDTGPGHMAAALGVPLVSVLGPTEATRYGARGPRVQHVQETPWPTVDRVAEAVEHALATA